MKIYAYQSPHGNLGDDLNHWLWPRVLRADFLKKQAVFMGIGSVIHANHLKTLPPDLPLIIFGAGCRSASNPFESLDLNPQISMVRGPLSAKALNIHSDFSGLDAAYAIQFTKEYESLLSLPKRNDLTLIPYFRSGPLVHYGFIEKTKGWNLLRSDRYGSISDALRTIAQSKFILTESLHGAILADSLRVPWMRLWYYLERAEDKETGEFKWADWQQSLKIDHIPTLRIPLDFPQWVAGRKGRLLTPWRTLRYFQHAHIDKEFTLSPETYWREKSQFLEDRLQSVQQ